MYIKELMWFIWEASWTWRAGGTHGGSQWGTYLGAVNLKFDEDEGGKG